jgi:hypothetical protein
LNDDLSAKIEVANESSSCVEHVIICNRCKDFDINACDEHIASIAKLNDEVASLNAQLKTCKVDFDKLKFARDAYTIGRHPSIKDGLGFQKEAKNLTSQRAPIFNKEKGKALWLVAYKRIMLSCIIGKLLVIIGDMIMMLMIHMLCSLQVLMVGLGKVILCIMCLGEYVINLLQFIMLATLHLHLYVKMKK